MNDADHRQRAPRHFHRRRGVEFAKFENVAQRLRFLFADQQVDFHLVLKTQRRLEVALRPHPRPADRRRDFLRHNGQAERTEKSVLGRFHETEEIRIVHDARHVGVGKFHAADCFEFVSHARNLVSTGAEFTRGNSARPRRIAPPFPGPSFPRRTFAQRPRLFAPGAAYRLRALRRPARSFRWRRPEPLRLAARTITPPPVAAINSEMRRDAVALPARRGQGFDNIIQTPRHKWRARKIRRANEERPACPRAINSEKTQHRLSRPFVCRRRAIRPPAAGPPARNCRRCAISNAASPRAFLKPDKSIDQCLQTFLPAHAREVAQHGRLHRFCPAAAA
jgi:hypothetical protein